MLDMVINSFLLNSPLHCVVIALLYQLRWICHLNLLVELVPWIVYLFEFVAEWDGCHASYMAGCYVLGI